ncbi:hypothetical protein RIR_jg13030.t1 [Rhizophagus irregularis DAOM 181602=DAOM 197198]|nr:hypothetical protein RIR_jg13030.t1 [Rhizophagus irregularis DAOM 181602=DAOM 197198]
MVHEFRRTEKNQDSFGWASDLWKKWNQNSIGWISKFRRTENQDSIGWIFEFRSTEKNQDSSEEKEPRFVSSGGLSSSGERKKIKIRRFGWISDEWMNQNQDS